MIVLEEEIQHQQKNYNNLVKEQERLLKDKAEQDQRLQREIRDRLCLKMVRNADPLVYVLFGWLLFSALLLISLLIFLLLN